MTAGVLSSEAAAGTAMVGAVAADAEKAYIDSLPDEDLFDAVATVQSELEKAKAALARKRPAPERLTSTKGPFAFFEGTPIDCGAVADAAVDAYMGALSDVELEAMATQAQAELAAAVAALEKKRAARGDAAPATRSAGAASAATPAPALSSKSSGAGPLSPAQVAQAFSPVAEAMSPLVGRAMELLEDASAQTGVPKTTLAAAIVGGAVAGAALVLGSLLRRK
jgi:hypothetical protein